MSRQRVDPRLIDELAWAQGGIVSSRQLLDAGIPSWVVQSRTRTGGPWDRLLPAVYLTHRGPASLAQLRTAAVIYAGPGAQLTGSTAADLYGLRYLPRAPSDPIHVLIEHERRVSSRAFVRIERTRRLPDPLIIGSSPVAPVARALVDAVRGHPIRQDVRALLLEGVQRGLVTLEDLEREIADAQIRGTALARAVLLDAEAGVRSAPEADLRDLFRMTGTPEPLWNPTLLTEDGEFLCEPDGYYEDCGLVLEVNSVEHHGSGQAFERTESRQSRITAYGLPLMPITPRRIRQDGLALVAEVRRARAFYSGRPHPVVRVIPRPARRAA